MVDVNFSLIASQTPCKSVSGFHDAGKCAMITAFMVLS